MKVIATLIAAVVIAFPVNAADSFTIDSRHTFPFFEVSHLGFSMQRGRFNKTSGRIVIDAAAQKGSVEASIDTASIDMGLDDWDKHMRSDEFFNVEKYPSMSFKADKLVFDAGRPVAAEGALTLLGVTRPTRLSIANYSCALHFLNRKLVCGAEVSGTIRRSDFGMTRFLPMIGDEIRIVIPIEATKD